HKFDVLVCAEPSRLSRDMIDLLNFARALNQAGIRIYCYETGETIDTSSATSVMMTGFKGFSGQHYREFVASKTRSKLAAKHEAGDCTGSVGFGYKRVEITHGGKRTRVEVEVVPEQAAVVKRIFELAANGTGILKIANTLQAENAPAPPHGWTKST